MPSIYYDSKVPVTPNSPWLCIAHVNLIGLVLHKQSIAVEIKVGGARWCNLMTTVSQLQLLARN